ncbi:hypothetical protein FOZ61_005330 [Perkinsus olseni]|uniref:Isopentenyl phosphate kinase n=1 Tax=Perkinsus olseni TaxID=32597 RepID=A0A7J6LHF4_PEROL|nr:hypothetical protein FOZ61_005330 [Perkinsus olseni]
MSSSEVISVAVGTTLACGVAAAVVYWKKRGSKCTCVIKIGGSACTKKDEFETLDDEILSKTAEQLSEAVDKAGARPMLIHGAGSFGHFQAKDYAVSKGDTEESGKPEEGSPYVMSRFLAKGFVATRASVGRLNSMVVDVLVKHGLKAVGMGSCGYLWTSEKKLPWFTAWGHVLYEGLSGLLNAGIIPVMYGDCVLDDKQVCTILSGDTIFYWMCRAFKPSRGIFLTDVAGIFDKPPNEDGAKLIPRISARGDVKSSIETCVPAHDVTGGIKTKLASAVKVAGELGIPVYIVQAGTPSALQAMEGREPEVCTVVVP